MSASSVTTAAAAAGPPATAPSTAGDSSRPVTHFHLTGFGEFMGVKQNPTQQLMETLPAYLRQHPLPAHIRIDGLTVLETSGAGSLETLKTLRHTNNTNTSAAAVASSATFSPSQTAHCNTQEDFARLRAELRAYGLERLQRDMLAAGWFIQEGSNLVLNTSDKPFNPFARIVSGKLVPPYGNLLRKHQLADADATFFVAQNRPEFDAQWASSEAEWVGKASMAQRHQFLLLKSLHWPTFNVATFGMDGGATSLRSAIDLLDRMEETAREYAKRDGWSSSLGLFFHCYPFNSVQATHLHLVDMETRGPTFDYLNHKNLPLEAVRKQLVEELKATEAAASSGAAADAQTPPASSAPAKSRSVYLHFGVHAGSDAFKLESTAFNCADFRVPDQRNWQPCNEKIQAHCPPEMHTQLNVEAMVRQLTCPTPRATPADQDGATSTPWRCLVSTDPGRFVCNWIFFNSLDQSAATGAHSLFVHVPAHDVYSLEQQQKFAREVILAVADMLDQQEAGTLPTMAKKAGQQAVATQPSPDEQLKA